MTKIITFGVFDFLHIGHLRLFKQCKQYGDYLIVAVQETETIKQFKPSAKVLYSTEQRIEMLEALRVVDEVITYKTVCTDFLKNIDFDVLALGEDHVGGRFDLVKEWCISNNRKVVYLKRTPNICSSEIKKQLS